MYSPFLAALAPQTALPASAQYPDMIGFEPDALIDRQMPLSAYSMEEDDFDELDELDDLLGDDEYDDYGDDDLDDLLGDDEYDDYGELDAYMMGDEDDDEYGIEDVFGDDDDENEWQYGIIPAAALAVTATAAAIRTRKERIKKGMRLRSRGRGLPRKLANALRRDQVYLREIIPTIRRRKKKARFQVQLSQINQILGRRRQAPTTYAPPVSYTTVQPVYRRRVPRRRVVRTVAPAPAPAANVPFWATPGGGGIKRPAATTVVQPARTVVRRPVIRRPVIRRPVVMRRPAKKPPVVTKPRTWRGGGATRDGRVWRGGGASRYGEVPAGYELTPKLTSAMAAHPFQTAAVVSGAFALGTLFGDQVVDAIQSGVKAITGR